MKVSGAVLALKAIEMGIPIKFDTWPHPIVYAKVDDGREGLWWAGFKNEQNEEVLLPASDISLEYFIKEANKMTDDQKFILGSNITLNEMKRGTAH